jgi:hypothetical protein
LYGSAVWLDPWDVGIGLGDSLEDYRRVEGLPLSNKVFNTRKEVYPLRLDCPGPHATEIAMSNLVYRGLPKKCWVAIPDLHGSYSYHVVVAGLVITNGTLTLSFDLDYVLMWRDSDEVWVENFVPVDLITLVPLGDYPEGTGLELNTWFDDGSDFMSARWLLPEGSQQSDWVASGPPTLPLGWTIVDPGSASSTFVSVATGWSVNPNDIFPE